MKYVEFIVNPILYYRYFKKKKKKKVDKKRARTHMKDKYTTNNIRRSKYHGEPFPFEESNHSNYNKSSDIMHTQSK